MRVNVFNPISFITYYYLYICLNVNFNFFFSVKKMYAGCSSVLLAPKKNRCRKYCKYYLYK